MTLQTGNPYKREVPNVSNRELEQRIQGLFKNWYTQGNKQDYMSAFPTLLGLEPNDIDEVVPFQLTDSDSGADNYSNVLSNTEDDDIIVATGAVISCEENFQYEFTNEDGDSLYGPIFGSSYTKSDLNGPNKLIPNYKGKNLKINVTLSTSGGYSMAIQGGIITSSTSGSVDLNPGT